MRVNMRRETDIASSIPPKRLAQIDDAKRMAGEPHMAAGREEDGPGDGLRQRTYHARSGASSSPVNAGITHQCIGRPPCCALSLRP